MSKTLQPRRLRVLVPLYYPNWLGLLTGWQQAVLTAAELADVTLLTPTSRLTLRQWQFIKQARRAGVHVVSPATLEMQRLEYLSHDVVLSPSRWHYDEWSISMAAAAGAVFIGTGLPSLTTAPGVSLPAQPSKLQRSSGRQIDAGNAAELTSHLRRVLRSGDSIAMAQRQTQRVSDCWLSRFESSVQRLFRESVDEGCNVGKRYDGEGQD